MGHRVLFDLTVQICNSRTAKSLVTSKLRTQHALSYSCKPYSIITIGAVKSGKTLSLYPVKTLMAGPRSAKDNWERPVFGQPPPAAGPVQQPELRKQAMSMTRRFSLGLLGAFVAVMLTSPQAATQIAQQGEGRDAAIRRCIAEAHRQFPGDGGQSQDMQRADVYKACMVNAGFQP